MYSTSRRICVNHPDIFCYMCGGYILNENRKLISAILKRCYFANFDIHLKDLDKSWTPHVACKIYVENLRQWTNGKRKGLKFEVPTV